MINARTYGFPIKWLVDARWPADLTGALVSEAFLAQPDDSRRAVNVTLDPATRVLTYTPGIDDLPDPGGYTVTAYVHLADGAQRVSSYTFIAYGEE